MCLLLVIAFSLTNLQVNVPSSNIVFLFQIEAADIRAGRTAQAPGVDRQGSRVQAPGRRGCREALGRTRWPTFRPAGCQGRRTLLSQEGAGGQDIEGWSSFERKIQRSTVLNNLRGQQSKL